MAWIKIIVTNHPPRFNDGYAYINTDHISSIVRQNRTSGLVAYVGPTSYTIDEATAKKILEHKEGILIGNIEEDFLQSQEE